MVLDEDLVSRTRAALGGVRGVTEIRMFGGLCFTARGNMALGVTRNDLMVRLAPDEGEAALTTTWRASDGFHGVRGDPAAEEDEAIRDARLWMSLLEAENGL
jgi:hypothetical protein